MDRYSPVAPAGIRVLVLPVGRIERRRFFNVLNKLQRSASIVELADLPATENHLLAAQVTSQGSLLFSYLTAPPSEQESQLSPFEIFRQPLLVLGVANGLSDDDEDRQKELDEIVRHLRERHPRVVHRHVLLLQANGGQGAEANNVTVVRESDDSDGPALRFAMCEAAAQFLVELTTYTKALQVSPTVKTPGQTSRGQKRVSASRVPDQRPASGYATPTQNTGVSSPVGEDGTRPSSRGFGSAPPTSFDQMQGANNLPSASSRSDSRTGTPSGQSTKRTSSQDRVTAHGFGTITSKEKDKNRGKARVGIVIGHIHLMAGQWPEALRMLVEHTTVVRKLSDNLWHAKGLEGLLVCMLLLAWAGISFSIPSICFATMERGSSAHAAKLSVNLPADFRPAEVAFQAAVGRLSSALPELLRYILSLYRSGEGSLELSPLALHEVTIRFCELLATLRHEGGELNGSARTQIVERSKVRMSTQLSGLTASSTMLRNFVAGMLGEAQPTDDDNLVVADHVSILAGISSVYSSLGMERKKGMVLKEIIDRLTTALIQARKLGAAEAGIHPAASLSADAAADSIAEIAAEGGGVDKMIEQIADIYGVILLPADTLDESPRRTLMENASCLAFGNDLLKTAITQALVTFCEASPDPKGVLRTSTSLLRSVAAPTARDSKSDTRSGMVAKDDQIRLATTISRIVAVSKHLGLPDVEAEYWDPFLVRHIDFGDSAASNSLVAHPHGTQQGKLAEPQTSGNPLLYDPNAGRLDNTAQDRQIAVNDELLECIVTLQNPLEVAVDIEGITLVTDSEGSIELETHQFVPMTLEPLCFKQVSLSVLFNGVGDFLITGCLVKIAGCREELFPFYSLPWVPSEDLLVKYHGRDAKTTFTPGFDAERATVLATAIKSMPVLELEGVSILDSRIMLLDGERRSVDVILRNTSRVTAAIISVTDSRGIMRMRYRALDDGLDDFAELDLDVNDMTGTLTVVQPGESMAMNFDLLGKIGVSDVTLDILYARGSSQEEEKFARVVSVPIHMTVAAVLQVRLVDIVEDEDNDNGFVLTFDLRNVCRKRVSYNVEVWQPEVQDDPYAMEIRQKDMSLSGGEVQRIANRFERFADFGGNASVADVKQELLRRLRVSWRKWGSEARWGAVDLEPLELKYEHLRAIRGRATRLRLHVLGGGDGVAPLKLGSFVTVRATLTVGEDQPSPLCIELQSPHVDKKNLGVVGVTQRMFPALWVEEEEYVDFVLCLTTPGVLELNALARPAVPNAQLPDVVSCTERPLVLRIV